MILAGSRPKCTGGTRPHPPVKVVSGLGVSPGAAAVLKVTGARRGTSTFGEFDVINGDVALITLTSDPFKHKLKKQVRADSVKQIKIRRLLEP